MAVVGLWTAVYAGDMVPPPNYLCSDRAHANVHLVKLVQTTLVKFWQMPDGTGGGCSDDIDTLRTSTSRSSCPIHWI